jgi:hypothetical protein
MYTTSQQTRESNTVKHRKPTHASLLSGLEPCCYYNPDLRREISFACLHNITKEGKNLTCMFQSSFFILIYLFIWTHNNTDFTSSSINITNEQIIYKYELLTRVQVNR